MAFSGWVVFCICNMKNIQRPKGLKKEGDILRATCFWCVVEDKLESITLQVIKFIEIVIRKYLRCATRVPQKGVVINHSQQLHLGLCTCIFAGN